jgi:hypothetical protein
MDLFLLLPSNTAGRRGGGSRIAQGLPAWLHPFSFPYIWAPVESACCRCRKLLFCSGRVSGVSEMPLNPASTSSSVSWMDVRVVEDLHCAGCLRAALPNHPGLLASQLLEFQSQITRGEGRQASVCHLSLTRCAWTTGGTLCPYRSVHRGKRISMLPDWDILEVQQKDELAPFLHHLFLDLFCCFQTER